MVERELIQEDGQGDGGAEVQGDARGVILRTEGPQPLALVTGDGLPENGSQVRCYVPKPLPGAQPGEAPQIVVGDEVRLRPRTEDVWEIVERGERRTVLQRGEPGRPGLQAIVANVDQIVIVVALRRPEPSRYRLDRLLVLADQAEIPAIVCLNKVDEPADQPEARAILHDYELAGYGTLMTSALTGFGIEDLRALLRGQTTAFVGESGVGKSSLANALYPGLGLRIGEVSAPGRGTHTTTAARLLPTPDGCLADTPGVQFLLPADIEPDEAGDYFPEIVARHDQCRFPNCSHTQEVGCAILRAVEAGEIGRARWESYVTLRQDLADAWRRGRDAAYRARRAARR